MDTEPKIEQPETSKDSGIPLPEIAVLLFIVFALMLVGCPFPMIAKDRSAKSADTKNIRQLGICLMAESSASPDERYPSTYNGTNAAGTSTEVFNYLISQGVLPRKDLVYSPGATKRKSATGDKVPDLQEENIGYNYMTAAEGGVTKDADDKLPLLWSAGNEPLQLKDGSCELRLKKSGIWKTTGAAVYYKDNSASFKKATAATETNGCIINFTPATFTTKGITYKEQTP